MAPEEILRLRLLNQQIQETSFKKADELVKWMGAMQAQEYAMAKWAIGLRLPGSKDNEIEKAFNEGKILRTHLLRPTWHFVNPEDIRWMLKLSAPRIHAANNFMLKKMGLDLKFLKRSLSVFEKVLEGKNHLTRDELREELKNSKLICDGAGMSHVMMHAELEGIVCSGPRKGKQFTYALLEERVTKTKVPGKDESLHELAHRYFRSRGPATLKDFSTWSGLTVADAKKGISSLDKKFLRETIGDIEYIFYETIAKKTKLELPTFLMPDYDEYGISYKDRSLIFDAGKYKTHVSRGNAVFNRMMIHKGIIEGTWQRVFKKDKAIVELFPFKPLTTLQNTAYSKALQNYQAFIGNDAE